MKSDFHIVSKLFAGLVDIRKVNENSKELRSCRSTNHDLHLERNTLEEFTPIGNAA